MFMKSMVFAALVVGSPVFAQSIPANLEFPVKNGNSGEVYRMADHPNGVFVFEAFQLFCGGCNANASNVDAFTTEFAGNPRVQVLDLGLDKNDSDFAQWIQRHNSNHPVMQDVGLKVFRALKTENKIPQVFVVNCRGEKVGGHIGGWDGSAGDKIRGFIAKALETTCQ